MFGTLKAKFSLVYVCLVAMIVVIGAIAVASLYDLSGATNGLMIANYKSIDAMNRTIDALERLDSAILMFINGNAKEADSIFSENRVKFEKWLKVEEDNVTESGEKQLVAALKERYSKFIEFFSRIKGIRNYEGVEKAAAFYEITVMPEFLALKKESQAIIALNEKAMFKGKDEATKNARRSVVIILVSSVFLAFAGLSASGYFVGRLLKPIYSLTDTLKTIREGNINQRAAVFSEDEIGVLANEFNNMTERLSRFEQSTLGSVMAEKNRTLAILKSISDPLIVLDKNYRIVLLNSAFEDFFGLKEETAAGLRFPEAIKNAKLFDLITLAYERGRPAGSPEIMELQGKDKNNHFKITVTRVEGRDSSLTGLVVSFHNVTDLKNLEKIKSDFIYVISHEFKTPLTSIIMGTSLLLDENIGATNPKQAEILEAIREDGERLSELVISLLELSRIESDRSVYKMKSCSINEIIETALKPFYAQAEAKGVRLAFSPGESVPPITADFGRICCVIDNLVSNAMKHAGHAVEVSARSATPENKVAVTVRDDGEGVAPELVERIFEKFFRIEKAGDDHQGTGLGLSIAREIIEAHGGLIWCESEPGKGCAFVFELPQKSGENP